MIFNTRLGHLCALLVITSGFSSFANNTNNSADLQKAKYCVSWLVDGAPFIRTANSLASKKADPARTAKYPLPYVLNNLGLGQWIPQAWRDATQIVSNPRLIYTSVSESGAQSALAEPFPSAGANILSLGEGRSDVLPLLIGHGLKAIALDPENDAATGLGDDYLAKYFANTVAGSATDLSVFADGSQNTVVSHALLPYLSRQERVDALRESFRVLAATGTARHSLLIPDVRGTLGDGSALYAQYEALLVDSVKQLVQDALGDSGYQLSVFIDEPRMRVTGSAVVKLGDLVDSQVNSGLTLERLKSDNKPLENKALNLLIVLRRPDDSMFSWESLFGR